MGSSQHHDEGMSRALSCIINYKDQLEIGVGLAGGWLQTMVYM